MRTLLLCCSLLLIAGCSRDNEPVRKGGPLSADDQPVQVADNTGKPVTTVGGFTVSHPNLRYDHKVFVQNDGYKVACFEMVPKIFNTGVATANKWSLDVKGTSSSTPLATISSKDNQRIDVDFGTGSATVASNALAVASERFTTAVLTLENQPSITYPQQGQNPTTPLTVLIHYCPTAGCAAPNPCQ